MEKDRKGRLYSILKLIDRGQYVDAANALQEEIIPVNVVASKEENRLLLRSNSFISGAIENLRKIQAPPKVNVFTLEGREVSSEYAREKAEKVKRAEECVRTVIEGPRNRELLEMEERLRLQQKISALEMESAMNRSFAELYETLSDCEDPIEQLKAVEAAAANKASMNQVGDESATDQHKQDSRSLVFALLREAYDQSGPDDRKRYFVKKSGRRPNGARTQSVYFERVYQIACKDVGIRIDMERFIRDYVRPFIEEEIENKTDKEKG